MRAQLIMHSIMNIQLAHIIAKNTETLCQSLVLVAEENGHNLVEQAKPEANLFGTWFSLFAKRHNTYNAKLVTTEDISELGRGATV